MASTPGFFFLLALGIAAANLPFLTRKVFLVWAPEGKEKHFGWRLVELLVLYVVVGLIARLIEGRSGQVYPQNWEFYAITLALFLVLAYPGFVYRYLWRRDVPPLEDEPS